MSEREHLLKGVRKDIILDPSSDLPGFIASELEQEELLRDPTYHSTEQETEDPENGEDDEEEGISVAKRNVILGSMFIGVFLASLDGTIVTTLISHIASEFNALPKISWIATSYLVSSATFQPLYGKLSDIFGRRALLLFCNLAFAIGCLLCSLAGNVNLLILGRFISGVGGGGLTALTTITTSDLVPLKSRGVYQGLSNIAFGLGTAVGGVVGGLFADHPSMGGWRGAFLAQVPLTLLSTLSIHLFLKLPKGSLGLGVSGNDITKKLKIIDWFGSISLITFLLMFLTGASFGGKELPYNSWGFILLAIGTVAALVSFILIELYYAKTPVLPLEFLSIPTVVGVSLSNFFLCVTSFTSYYYVPVYYTAIFNLSSTEIGKRFSPNFFSIIVGSLGAGFYMRKTGRYRNLLLLSGVVAVFGTYRIVKLNPNYSVFEQYILFITPGIGFSVIITATLLALIAAVPHEHQAATTSISYLFRSCGSTLGVSTGSAIFSKKLELELDDKVLKFLSKGYDLAELKQIIYEAAHNTEYVQNGAPAFIKNALIEAYESSLALTFQFCLLTCFFGFLSLFLIKEYVLHASMKRK